MKRILGNNLITSIRETLRVPRHCEVRKQRSNPLMKTALAVLALILATPAFAAISASPTRVEINANKLRNNYAVSTIEVSGDAQKPIRFRLYPAYFTITNTSEINLDAPKDDPHNLSKSLRFVPSEFTVPPGKTQKVRINIANVKSLPDGESRAILFLEDINTKEMNVPTQGGISAQLIIKTRLGIPVYVDKGKFTKKADIEYLNANRTKDGFSTEMKIVSSGNSRVRYNGKFQVVQGKKLLGEYILEDRAVGDNNYYVAKQDFKADCIKGAGDYTIRAVVGYQDQDGNKKIIKKDTVLKVTGEI